MSLGKVELRAGSVLFRQGDPPTTAFLVESGRLEIRAHQNGQEMVLSVLGPGAILGEMAVIDQAPRTATAVALDDCRLQVLDREQIAERLEKTDPVVRALLQGTLRRYRSVLSALNGGGAKPALERTEDGDAGLGKMRLEGQLREALENSGLDVRYQPLLSVPHGEIAGYEALVRWTHPERGPISPMEFITLAEETSLIVPVGDYVFATACQAVRRFIDAGPALPPHVAVNVSARQLREPGLIQRVVERVDAAGVPRGSIKIEITESQALDYGLCAAFIELCHAHGIKVALDDFGTGYSHLTHLHALPFDVVKVDQGFVRTMLESRRSMKIVEAIVAMAKSLDAEIVVEGIETDAHLDVLRRLECDYAQGWLIGKPQTVDELLARP